MKLQTFDLNIGNEFECWNREVPRNIRSLSTITTKHREKLAEEYPNLKEEHTKHLRPIVDSIVHYHNNSLKQTHYKLIEKLNSDPLSKMSRLERRNSIAMCTIIFFIIIFKLDPSGLNILGISFANISLTHLYVGLLTLVSYFCIAFYCYSANDRNTLDSLISNHYEIKRALYDPIQSKVAEHLYLIKTEWLKSLTVAALEDFDATENFGYSVMLDGGKWMEESLHKNLFLRSFQHLKRVGFRNFFDFYFSLILGAITVLMLVIEIAK
jgi:hypothetical protein